MSHLRGKFNNIFYVAPHGDDNNDGSLLEPYLTVSKAITEAGLVSTAVNPIRINIKSGAYTESPFTIPSYVTVDLEGATLLQTNDNSNHFITMSTFTTLNGGIIIGPTTTSYACIYSESINARINKTTINIADIGILTSGATGTMILEGITILPPVNTGVSAISSSDIKCSNVFSLATVTHFKCDNSTMLIHNSGIQAQGSGNGIYITNGGSCNPYLVSVQGILDYVIRMSGASSLDGSGIYTPGLGEIDIYQEDSASIVHASNSGFHSDRFLVTNWSNVIIDFHDDKEGDEGKTIAGELHVGMPEKGQESTIGEGDSYTRGMKVFTATSAGIFADVSAEAKSASGSTFTFSENATNAAIYISSDLENGTYLKHHGIKCSISVPAIIGTGGGTIVAEYWDESTGGGWTEFAFMVTDSNSPYLPHAKELFEQSVSTQIRYDISIPNDDWGVNNVPDESTGAPDRFWIRFRLTDAIDTLPIFEQFKLHTSRHEINADGWVEYFGNARPLESLPWNIAHAAPAGTNPADGDVYYSDNLDVGMLENALTGIGDRVAFDSIIPENFDTSSPINFKVAVRPDDTGVFNYTIRWTWIEPDTAAYPSAAAAPATHANEQSLTGSIAVTNDTVNWLSEVIDVSSAIPRRPNGFSDIIALSIERTSGSEVVDLLIIDAKYTKWCEGGHA